MTHNERLDEKERKRGTARQRALNALADCEAELRELENAILYFERTGCGNGGVVAEGDLRIQRLARKIVKRRRARGKNWSRPERA